MKRQKLHIETPSSTYSSTYYVGLNTVEKDYRLIYFLNKSLNISLLPEQVEINGNSIKKFVHQASSFSIHFIENKQNGLRVFKNLKQADFLIKVVFSSDEKNIQDFKSILEKIDIIRAIFAIDNSLFSKQKLSYFD